MPDEVATRILDAGRLSGSSRNTQQWEFVVVAGAAAERSPRRSTRPRTCVGATLVVAIVGDAGGFDVGRCAQNMMLAAWGDGVVSCPNGIRDADAAAAICGGEVQGDHLLRLSGEAARSREPQRRGVVGAGEPQAARRARPRTSSATGSAARRPTSWSSARVASTSNASRTVARVRVAAGASPSVPALEAAVRRVPVRRPADRDRGTCPPRCTTRRRGATRVEREHRGCAGPVTIGRGRGTRVDRDVGACEDAASARARRCGASARLARARCSRAARRRARRTRRRAGAARRGTRSAPSLP